MMRRKGLALWLCAVCWGVWAVAPVWAQDAGATSLSAEVEPAIAAPAGLAPHGQCHLGSPEQRFRMRVKAPRLKQQIHNKKEEQS